MSKSMYEVTEDEGSINDPSTPLLTPRRRQPTKRQVVICTCIFVGILLLVITFGVGGYFAYNFLKNDSNKRDCILPGVCNSNVFEYMSSNLDPCDDFFQYSCGGWLANNPIKNREEWGIFDQLTSNNYAHLKSYLTQKAQKTDTGAIQKAKYIYSSCVNSKYIDDHLLSHLRTFFNESGGWQSIGIWPADDWNSSELVKYHYLGSPALFSFNIAPDDLNSSMPVIKIRQDGLSLTSPEAYEDTDLLSELIETVARTLQQLGVLDYDFSYYNELANNIVYYEKYLAEHWLNSTAVRNLSTLYNPMTLQNLSEIAEFNWVEYFNTFFEYGGFTGSFTNSTIVIVETVDYFRFLNKSLAIKDYHFTEVILVNYVKWQLLLNEIAFVSASMDSFSSDLIRKIKYPKSSRLGRANDFACVEMVENSMPLAVARPFVKEFITDELKMKVNETVNQIQKAFIQRVVEKDWLDRTTKDRCVNKVNSITRQIAYPDFIEIDSQLDNFYGKLEIDSHSTIFDIEAAIRHFTLQRMLSTYTKPVDKTEWLNPPTEVNAYYSAQFNQFVFLSGILRPPFIAANWPPFLLYGGIGVVIGHELTHGFDNQGQQFDKNGNRVKWWTASSTREFTERTECFVDQYDQYSLLGVKIDGQLTLNENLADNGGVHTAFRAYKNVMNGTEPQLIRQLTEDQLFFVAFAQLWCSEFTKSALEMSSRIDLHSPGPIRVLGSLVNSEEFASAFNCSRGSRMYPSDDQCELW